MVLCIIVFLTSILIFWPSSASADMTVHTHGSFKMMGMQIADINSTLMLKGNMARNFSEDISGAVAPLMKEDSDENHISINRFDDEVTWILFPDKKKYSVRLFTDTVQPLVDNQQSLDSSLMTPTQIPPAWIMLSFSHNEDSVLGIPCKVTKAVICSDSATGSKLNTISCELWMASAEEHFPEYVNYMTQLQRATGQDEFSHLSICDALLQQFSASLKDMHMDTLSGFPMRTGISVNVLLDEEILTDLSTRTTDTNSIDTVLVDVADSTPVSQHSPIITEYDSIKDALIQSLRNNRTIGQQEIFGFISEITSIDTTALPDSLFEIPEGYTER